MRNQTPAFTEMYFQKWFEAKTNTALIKPNFIPSNKIIGPLIQKEKAKQTKLAQSTKFTNCWGSKLTIAQGLKKNNTLGYPVMKKGKKKEEEDEKVQRIGIQRPMKGKSFKIP